MVDEGKVMGLRNLWWARIAAKLLLSRLPIPYRFWRRVGLFRHGEMNNPQRAIDTFVKYFDLARKHQTLRPNFTSLELGPGDSLLSGFVANAYGASRTWMLDAGNFAETTVEAVGELSSLLEQRGKSLTDFDSNRSFDATLDAAGVTYLTGGISSMQHIPSDQVDFCWSQVVLEHVYREEFPMLLSELRRVMSSAGVSVHSIDFRDHLGGGLNNLRLSNYFWESRLGRTSGFYTNRLRPQEILNLMTAAGFDIEVVNATKWPSMPISRHQLAKQFQHLDDSDFMVAEIEVVMRPR